VLIVKILWSLGLSQAERPTSKVETSKWVDFIQEDLTGPNYLGLGNTEKLL
jgi:hypothetical protein